MLGAVLYSSIFSLQVGTTSFDKLIQQIDTPDFLRAVQQKGYKSLTIQVRRAYPFDLLLDEKEESEPSLAATVALGPVVPFQRVCSELAPQIAFCAISGPSCTLRNAFKLQLVLFSPRLLMVRCLRLRAKQLGRGVYLPKNILPEGQESATLGKGGFRIECAPRRPPSGLLLPSLRQKSPHKTQTVVAPAGGSASNRTLGNS